MATTETQFRLKRELLVLGGVVLIGMILAVLDATIVNVAIPTLGRDFHASISTIQWVMTAYLLAFAGVIPLTGWAIGEFGPKRVWLAALVLFLTGSVLSGSAWAVGPLIVFRVLQGIGAGLIMPVGQAILAQAAGPNRVGRVMSVMGVPILLAPIFGPVIGGAIVDQISWRWIFFVNLPLGVVAIALAQRLIDVSLFARRGFATAATTTLLLGIALFGALILLPLYFQLVRGESPLATGLLLVPQGVGAALAMPIAGKLTDEIGARVVIPVGILVALAGTAAYAQVGPHTSYAFLAGALFVIGLGLGATIVPAMAVAFAAVPQEAVGAASSAINIVQRVAGSIGTALLAVVLQRSISGKGVSDGIGALAGVSPAALADAFGTAFWVALALVAVALIPALLLPRTRERPA